MPFVISSQTPTGDTFATLLDEFYARGFTYLDDGGDGEARAKRWINQAIAELSQLADWPFLEETGTGPAPLTISNLGRILSVVDSTSGLELYGREREGLIDYATDLTLAGSPSYWYLEGNSTLKVYPTSTTDQLSVRYITVPTDLSADADVSVVPKRYSNIVVDLAVCRGYKNKDAFEACAALRADVDRQVQEMMAAELIRGDDAFVAVTGASEDW